MAFDFDSLPLIDDDTTEVAPSQNIPAQKVVAQSPPVTTGFDFDALPIQDEEPKVPDEVETPTFDEQRLIDITEPILTIGGGIAGGIAGGPAGAIGGAAGGQALQEGLEKLLGKDKELFPNTVKSFIKDDTVVGNIVKEGMLAYLGEKAVQGAVKVGAKALKPISKALNPKEFIKTNNLINSEIGKKGIKAYHRLGNYLQGVIDEVPKDAKKEIIDKMAVSGDKSKSEYTRYVLNRGPKEVLKESNLESFAVKKKTIDAASKSFDDAFDIIDKEFDTLVTPILKKSDEIIDVTDVIRSYSDDLSEIAQVKQVGKKTRLIGRAGVEDDAVKQLEKFADDISRLSANPTPLQLHKFKQGINKVLKSKSLKENPNAAKVLTNLHKNVRSKIEDVVPGYKKITNDYRDVFELQEEIGSKLKDDRIESMVKSYFNPDKTILRSQIDRLSQTSPVVAKNIGNLLDERAAKEFISVVSKGHKHIGIPFTRVGASVAKPTERQLGKKLIKKANRGFKTRLQTGLRGGLDVATGRELQDIGRESGKLLNRRGE